MAALESARSASAGRKFRVLHASPCYAPAYRLGGPVRSLEGLLPALRQQGAEVRVITTDGHGRDRLEVPRGWQERDGIPVLYLRRWLRPDVTPEMFHKVVWEARKADVVHVTGFFCAPTVLSIAAAQMCGVPVVVSPRGALEPGSLRVGNQRAKRAWLRAFQPLFTSTNAFHATSDKEADSIKRALGAWAPTFVVPNGTAVSPLLSPKPAREVPIIGALGRLHPNKGYDRLIDACALLRDRGATFDLRIAGPENDIEYAQRLTAQIERHKLTDQARLCGELLHSAKDDFLRTCRVLALPSNETENFGNVVIEALAQGTPVVASSFSPWKELVTVGCGQWVPNTPEQLANALERYLADAAYAEEQGERGRALVEQRYTWQAAARQMLLTYRSLGHAEPS